ncbi:MAG: universal stress protein, partial [Anaerolineae bacterium]
MYARILAPLDGSPVADQVLPYVRLLGTGFQAQVELLRIFEPISPSLADPAHRLYLDQIIASERSHVEDYLEGV